MVDNQFTIPAAVNPGVVEWRVILEGRAQHKPLFQFRITAQEPGWAVDEFALYAQGFAMFAFCLAIVLFQRPSNKNEIENKYDNTQK